MLILSQDKTRIVNFKNKEDIFWKEDYYEGKFIGTKIIAIGKIDSLLGKYNTEERAKEVLQEIIKCYNSLKRKSVYAMGDSGFTFEEKFYYEMPEK